MRLFIRLIRQPFRAEHEMLTPGRIQLVLIRIVLQIEEGGGALVVLFRLMTWDFPGGNPELIVHLAHQ